jgi:two-component sensor histidine kinase
MVSLSYHLLGAEMDPERHLAGVFGELTAAGTRDACVRIAARAGSELADAYGVCLVSTEGEDSLVGLASRPPVYLCDLRNSGLYQSALTLRRTASDASRTLWAKEDCIMLPSGQRQPIRVALIVPLKAASHLALTFLWQPGRSADPRRARLLELLAKGLDLAASSWRKDEEYAARHIDQQRISAGVQHRLRNNLALVRSIIRRSNETAASAEHFALHLEARIGALTRIQGALVAAGASGVDLEELIQTELVASAVPEQRCLVQGPAVRLYDKGAELLALAVHELATNSLKFGALAAPSGRLAIRWSVADHPSGHLHLKWRESGVAIASSAPRHRGFGEELIECTLPYELGALTCFEFGPGTVLCEIHLPAESYVSVVERAVLEIRGASSW